MDLTEKYWIAKHLKGRRKWSGEELARAELAYDLRDYEIRTGRAKRNVFTLEMLKKRKEELQALGPIGEDAALYSAYKGIQGWLSARVSSASGYTQQLQFRAYRLQTWAQVSIAAEQTYLGMAARATKWEALKGTTWGDTKGQTWAELLRPLGSVSLPAYFPGSKDSADNREDARQDQALILASRRYVLGFNHALDMIAEVYSIPELDSAKPDLGMLDAAVNDYNSSLKALAALVMQDPDSETKAKKLDVLEHWLTPIDYQSQEIPAEDKDKALGNLVDFRFARGYPFLEYLTGMPE